jgi:hypothetical protein
MSDDPLQQLLQGKLFAVCQQPTGEFRFDSAPPQAIFPGSFNPLHAAHRELAEVAERCLGVPVVFELSITNVDKPALDECTIRDRLGQFLGYAPIWVTTAPTYDQKANLFPNCTFVMGYDTASRLIDPRYYNDQTTRRDACLRKLSLVGFKPCRGRISRPVHRASRGRLPTRSFLHGTARWPQAELTAVQNLFRGPPTKNRLYGCNP